MDPINTHQEWLSNVTGERFTLSAGDVIYIENDPFNGIFYIEEGCVKMIREKTDKQKVILFANADEFCGLKSYYTDNNRYLFTAAVFSSECRLVHIPRHELLHLMEKSTEFRKKVIKGLCKRIETTEHRILDFYGHNKKERYIESLLELALWKKQNQPNLRDNDIPLDCTLSEFSTITGSSEEYLKKITQQFNSMGIVALKESKVVVTNLNKLKNMI